VRSYACIALLLQALPVHQRQSYADRWSVLEAALGRPSFHALFDHYITIEQATAAASQDSSSSNGTESNQQNSSWAHTPNDSSSNGSSGSGSITPFIPAGSSLMHLQPVSSDSSSNGHRNQHSETASGVAGVVVATGQQQRHDVLQQLTGHADVEGMLNMVLEYGQQLLQIRANDWSVLEAEGGTGELS
jgi:hypothetical protein